MLILEEFWRGNICPGETKMRPRSEYTLCYKRIEKCEEALNAELSQEGKKALEEYMDAVASLHDLAECDRFMEGFRMGAKFMLDIFQPEIHFAHHDS